MTDRSCGTCKWQDEARSVYGLPWCNRTNRAAYMERHGFGECGVEGLLWEPRTTLRERIAAWWRGHR